MHVRNDLNINLKPKFIMSNMENRQLASFQRPRIKEKFDIIIKDFHELVEPKLVYETLNISKNLNGKIEIETGHFIGGGPGLEIVKNAEKIHFGAMTIGDGVDKKMEESQEIGDLMSAVIYDVLGSWAISSTLGKYEAEFSNKLRNKKLYRSICITPGSIDWPIQDQKILFEILKPEQIGMKLTDSMLMIPTKSLSFIIGISKEPYGLDDQTKCDFCHRKEECEYRKYA